MRTSLKKLRIGIAAFKNGGKNKRRHRQPKHQLDELSQAEKDMRDMRDCYARLLSAAAATENSTFEFSESLGEIGDCLLEKTALSDFDDEESGKVLLMLGKVQFEIQRLVDTYRSHISQTITVPSESLTNELRVVEEMKKRCDGKREAYEDLLKKNREKGRLRRARVYFSSHHLKIARDEYDEESNAVIFRMRSLKQGQCSSLLTQAARHYTAQLSFFRKAFQSLEAIEPHVKSVMNEQHIDYQFTGLDDDDDRDEDEDFDDDGFSECIADDGPLDDSELSFDYRQDDQRQDAVLKESLENEGSPGSNSFTFQKEANTTSISAPLFSNGKLDPTSRLAELRPSPSQKYTSYVLPMPPEAKSPVSEVKSPVSGKAVTVDPETTRASFETLNLRHSSPLDQNKYEMLVASEVLSGSMLETKSVLRDSNHNTKARPLPPPLTECFIDPTAGSDGKTLERHAFSDPQVRKPFQNNPAITANGPVDSTGSGSILCSTPFTRPLSLRPSPTFILSRKISELHELPRPPPHSVSKTPTTQVGYSGPLTTKCQELSATNKLAVPGATTLPRPPPVILRSYSIPSRGQVEMTLHAWKPLQTSHNLQIHDEIGSPHLAPISLANIQPASPAS